MDQPSSTESNAITLRIKFKSASLDEFIIRYGADVSPGGIFIRTKQPVDVGTSLQFEFSLADGNLLLNGLGTVAWVRESDPARANNIPGMGLRFDKLSSESQHNHQKILAEKARREGKASSTPYPPTAFVAPASRPSPPPEAKVVETPAKPEPSVSNLAVTRPAPAIVLKSVPALSMTPAVPIPTTAEESDEFASGSKTEISERSADYYLREAEAEARRSLQAAKGATTKNSEDAVPNLLLEDWNTSEKLPPTKSGPPPKGLTDEGSDDDVPTNPAIVDPNLTKKSDFASLLNLDESIASLGETTAAPTEVLEEISAGVPIEETVPEKTEEVSLESNKPTLSFSEPLNVGGGSLDDERPPSRDEIPSLKPKRSAKWIAGIAIAAAAAAFGIVYLVKTKPWQPAKPPVFDKSSTSEQKPAVKPLIEQVKPAATEEIAAKKPEETKATAVVKTEPTKPAAEKTGEKAEAEKAVAAIPEDEKPAPEKTAGDKGEKAVLAKSGTESSPAKPASKSSSGKASAKAGEDKAGAEVEEIYRLFFKSTPIGAEVLIDGEYFSRTPCERRILDPKKTYAITFRREGFEQHERLLGPSDNWVKRGNEHVLTVSASLRRASARKATPTEATPPPAAGGEPKVEKWGDQLPPPAAKPESKPVPAPTEPAKVEPKPESAKTEPPPVPTEKPEKIPTFKPLPAPSFVDDPSKINE
jgi:uncharacterized protein (TIGR02266 family)